MNINFTLVAMSAGFVCFNITLDQSRRPLLPTNIFIYIKIVESGQMLPKNSTKKTIGGFLRWSFCYIPLNVVSLGGGGGN